jgi:hypothetical protein
MLYLKCILTRKSVVLRFQISTETVRFMHFGKVYKYHITSNPRYSMLTF